MSIFYDVDDNDVDKIPSKYRAAFENGDYKRASGGVICEECGKDYYHHPELSGARWLTILCDDSLVKL
jgi:hypothetical protein